MNISIINMEFLLSEIIDCAISETARKMYGNDLSKEIQDNLSINIAMTEDDNYWVLKYMASLYPTLYEKLQIFMRNIDAPIKVGENKITLTIKVEMGYDISILSANIHEAIVNYIVHKWYLMKGLLNEANVYLQLFNESLASIHSISVSGIRKKINNKIGHVSLRGFDDGFGIHNAALDFTNESCCTVIVNNGSAVLDWIENK